MKIINYKISFILFYGTLIFQYSALSQNSLPVEIVGQKTDLWCWASSMEMIVNYYNSYSTQQMNKENQCSIVENYWRMRKERSSLVPNYTGPRFNDCVPDHDAQNPLIVNTNYIHILKYNYKGEVNEDFLPSYFDLLFSRLNYSSIEDFNLLTWQEYKQEIQNCRPVIILYYAQGFQGQTQGVNNAQHAVKTTQKAYHYQVIFYE